MVMIDDCVDDYVSVEGGSVPETKAGTAMMKQENMASRARSCSTVCMLNGRLAGIFLVE